MTDSLHHGVRSPQHDVDHSHPRPMSPAEQAHDTGTPGHPLPAGAQDLRGAAYDARIAGHRAVEGARNKR